MMFRREKAAVRQRPSHHALELSHVTYRFGPAAPVDPT